MTKQQILQTLSVAIATFLGGALPFVVGALGSSQGAPEWKIIITGAAAAGVAAVVHLYQTPPGKTTVPNQDGGT